MPIQIQRKQLQAALLFAGNRDVRYYLNGVLVEPSPASTRLAATDGNFAAVQRHAALNADVPAMIIPREACAAACKLMVDVLTVEPNGEGYSIGGAANRILFSPVDGRFPDYRRILVTQFSGEAAMFNPDLLVEFAKAGRLLGRRDSPLIRQNGKGSALVHFYNYDDFIGIVMPLNLFTEKQPDLGWPAWGQEA